MGLTRDEATLEARTVPLQHRAQRRVAQILDATQALLEKGETVTTSTIARRAGIPVGSIYRYFPNIEGVKLSLFKRLSDQLRERMAQVISLDDTSLGWRDLHQLALEQSLGFIEENKAYGILRFLSPSPALDLIEEQASNFLHAILAKRWANGKDGFSGGDPQLVAQTASKLFNQIEQCHFETLTNGGAGAPLIEEMDKALIGYLSQYLAD